MEIPDQIWKLKLKRVPESFTRSPKAHGWSETPTFCFPVPCTAQVATATIHVHFASVYRPQDPKSIFMGARSLSPADVTNSHGNKLSRVCWHWSKPGDSWEITKLPLDSAADYQLGTCTRNFLSSKCSALQGDKKKAVPQLPFTIWIYSYKDLVSTH